VDWPADLDPRSLRQPDKVSCGAVSVVAARALLTGWRPEHPTSAIREEHRHLTSARSPRDRFQMPWPRGLGTPPWAVANALTALTGERIATMHARPRPAVGYDVLTEQVRTRPVGVYLGSRWLPRHVVLAFAAPDGGSAVRVFDPARGVVVDVARERWEGHRVGVAGWSHLWLVV
jgi:hypothetical protein